MNRSLYEDDFGLTYIFIGIVITAVSLGLFFNSLQKELAFRKTAVETTAIITEVLKIPSSGKKQSRTVVMISFQTVNGNTQTTRLDYVNSRMQAGDNVTIYYDPEQPDKISSGDPVRKRLFLGGIGLILGLVLFIRGCIALIRKKTWERLRQEGFPCKTDIVDCKLRPKGSSRSKDTYTLSCSYTDKNGDIRVFKSPVIFYDPREFISGKVIVYVDGQNKKKYFMDIRGAMKELKLQA